MKKYWDLFRAPLTPVYRLFIQPIACLFLPIIVRLPIHPNIWTVSCLGTKLWAGILIWQGAFTRSLIFWLILSMVFDSFDGAVARWSNKSSYLGSYLDRAVDQIGYAWIMSCLLAHLSSTMDEIPLLILAGLIIIGSILHETLRIWVSLTGGLLNHRNPVPRWDRWIRERGLLLFYGHDTAFFLIGLGLFFTPVNLAWTIAGLLFLSYGYQYFIHRRGVRQCGDIGMQLWETFHKTTLVRCGFLIFLAIVSVFLFTQTSNILPAFLLPWLEFLIFYFLANQLMSESARMPEEGQQRKAFIEELQQKDREFLNRWYP